MKLLASVGIVAPPPDSPSPLQSMAGMPRLTGLLKKGPQVQAVAAKNFSFTVAGQDSAKVAGEVLDW